jgi:hypothetical protein
MTGNMRKVLQTLDEADELADRLKSQFKQIVQNISFSQALIADCRDRGFPTEDIEDLLEKAISHLQDNEYDSSLGYSEESWKLAIKRKTRTYLVDALADNGAEEELALAEVLE